MSQALVVACIGYLMCFVVLGIIWAVLSVMKFLMVPGEKKPKVESPKVEKPAPVKLQPVNNNEDEELIAVLTAAIAASLNTSTYNLKIKSFKRLPNGVNNWGMAAVSDNLSNKLN